MRPYETWSPDEENSEKVLSRFAHQPPEDNPPAGPLLRPNLANGSPVKSRSSSDNEATSSRLLSSTPSMPAVYILHDYLLNPSQPDNPYKHALLFTGGDDRDLRYWDIQRPENSFIISGPELHNDDATAMKIKYELTYPLALSAGAQIALIQEKLSDEASSGGASSRGTPKKPSRSIRDQEGNARTSSPASTSASSPSKTSSASSSKPPRSTVISGAQQQILRTHMEGITDVIVLRKPYGCVVSVDRAGTIFIFH